jgi:hypothetical protein
MDETAEYVLDDLDFPTPQLESPSQISQRTVSVASETEDTLSGVPAPRRSAPVVIPPSLPVEPQPRRWPMMLIVTGLVAALLGAAMAAAWFFGLLR